MSKVRRLNDDQLLHVAELCEDSIELYLGELSQITVPGAQRMDLYGRMIVDLSKVRDVVLARLSQPETKSMHERMAEMRAKRKSNTVTK